jgi:large subunit ribosomal protein L18
MAKTHSQKKVEMRAARHRRIRARITGSADRPRLSVFKSNTGMYAQIIDDARGVTLMASSTAGLKTKSKLEKAREIGALLAKAAQAKGITKVVFDRGGFLYSGRIKAFADSARESGLIF